MKLKSIEKKKKKLLFCYLCCFQDRNRPPWKLKDFSSIPASYVVENILTQTQSWACRTEQNQLGAISKTKPLFRVVQNWFTNKKKKTFVKANFEHAFLNQHRMEPEKTDWEYTMLNCLLKREYLHKQFQYMIFKIWQVSCFFVELHN